MLEYCLSGCACATVTHRSYVPGLRAGFAEMSAMISKRKALISCYDRSYYIFDKFLTRPLCFRVSRLFRLQRFKDEEEKHCEWTKTEIARES